MLATRIAAAFGGWVIEHSHAHELPSLPYGVSLLDAGVREIVARDATQWREERYWVLDAQFGPAFWVRQ